MRFGIILVVSYFFFGSLGIFDPLIGQRMRAITSRRLSFIFDRWLRRAANKLCEVHIYRKPSHIVVAATNIVIHWCRPTTWTKEMERSMIFHFVCKLLVYWPFHFHTDISSKTLCESSAMPFFFLFTFHVGKKNQIYLQTQPLFIIFKQYKVYSKNSLRLNNIQFDVKRKPNRIGNAMSI